MSTHICNFLIKKARVDLRAQGCARSRLGLHAREGECVRWCLRAHARLGVHACLGSRLRVGMRARGCARVLARDIKSCERRPIDPQWIDGIFSSSPS